LTYTSNTTSPTIVAIELDNRSRIKPVIDMGRKGRTYSFALVGYKNHPSIRIDQSTAKKVIAGIRYYDESGKPLVNGKEIIARWWDEPEPRDIPRSQAPHALQEVDISPSGKKIRWLVIAMKHVLEDSFLPIIWTA